MSSGKELERSDFEAQYNSSSSANLPQEMTLVQIERDRIERVLIAANYNISKAASMLGLSRAALYRRLEKYSINKDKIEL